MTHFPNDKRRGEILNLDMASELASALRRLSVKLTPLEGFEEGFINAMEGRDHDPQGSAERIRQWLNVYDTPSSELDSQLSELVQLAKHEQKQLVIRARRINVHPNAQTLIDEIRSRVKDGDSESTRVYLIGIIETHGKDFGKDSWAKPAVDEARQQLELIDASSEAGESAAETEITEAAA